MICVAFPVNPENFYEIMFSKLGRSDRDPIQIKNTECAHPPEAASDPRN
tara:strand:- start:140 stop:286 length:147 start_codon:yes stop_codon:yes gene_type:complete